MSAKPKETQLYAPLKAFLQAQGYEVKAEVGAADLVAMRGDEPPLIVEMKTGFSLALFHQAIARQSQSDAVYVAVPRGTGKPFWRSLKANLSLARRLGLGLFTVTSDSEKLGIDFMGGAEARLRARYAGQLKGARRHFNAEDIEPERRAWVRRLRAAIGARVNDWLA